MPLEPAPTLARSRSPFLRHGASQPVSWLPWSEQAFDRARRENRPILLDIGAAWCHWCHVMDRESYEDEQIARLVNDTFVPVKVDRDERPDVDARYQRAVQALSGEGGWPLTAFLTPEGEVFYGGTYFPPEEGMGRPSFRRVLGEVARVWKDQRAQALDMARQLRERVSAYEQAESQAGQVTAAMSDDAVEEFIQSFDFRWGGFGRAPKFPNAGAMMLLLDHHLDAPADTPDWSLRVVVDTLIKMGRGGVVDQLGGGFHRYATDGRWLIPHFEKMAYDNGPLLEAYARAAAVAGEPLLRAVAEGIVAHYHDVAADLLREGGFPASQDADIGPSDDGDYWTWTEEEITAAVGDDVAARAAILRFGVDDRAAAMPHQSERHVLHLARDFSNVAAMVGLTEPEVRERLAEACARMKEVRDRRPRPLVDENVYTGWTSLVASGFIAAARYLDVPGAGEAGLRALDRIWEEAFDIEDGAVHRAGDREGAFLEDQAAFAVALLDAYEYTQREDYLDRARATVAVMLRRFLDEEGAFQDRPRDEAAPTRVLAEGHRPVTDAPAPAGNALAAIALLRLGALTQEASFTAQATKLLSVFAGSAPKMATSCATYFRAVDWATKPVTTVVVVGASGDAAADALLRTALATYRPRTVVRRLVPGDAGADQLPPELTAMVAATRGDGARAYVCVGTACHQPVREAEELQRLLTA